MNNLTLSEDVCIGKVMWRNNDDGVNYLKRILIIPQTLSANANGPEYSIEGVVYGLSEKELLEELQHPEYCVIFSDILFAQNKKKAD